MLTLVALLASRSLTSLLLGNWQAGGFAARGFDVFNGLLARQFCSGSSVRAVARGILFLKSSGSGGADLHLQTGKPRKH